MSNFPLIRKFFLALRRDGSVAALRQSTRYLLRRFLGRASSIFGLTRHETAQAPEKYLHGIWKTLSQEDAFHIIQSPSISRGRRQIAMIGDLNLPQCRKYRVEQLATFWRARGVAFEYAHFQDIPRATRIMQHATHLMEYRLKTSDAADMLRYEARRLRLPILYDLDDPLFSVSAYETYRNMDALDPAMKAHFMAEAPKYLSMMNGADILSVSTPGMADHAACFSGRPIYIRRNFADQETLLAGAKAIASKAESDDAFRVAFASGSQGHEADLKEILDPLADFVLSDSKRRLMLIGHFDPAHLPDGLLAQTEMTKFTDYTSYLKTLSQANAAVMPLCDDPFNRCKSAVRVLDASAVGVPSIVGSVGDFPSVVQSGQTGFVSQSKTDWIDALQDLAKNPDLAGKMGRGARSDLEKRWQGSEQSHIIAPELIDWVAA